MLVPVGSEREFVAKIVIPKTNNYTAIGNFVARFYLLVLKASYGHCNKGASAAIHLIVNSNRPRIVKNNLTLDTKSIYWRPEKFPLAKF